MNKNIKIQVLLVMSLFLIGLFGYKYSAQKSYVEDKKRFKEYKKQASTFISLQKSWNNKKEDKKLLNSIKKRFKPTSYRVEKDTHILTYRNLTKSAFSRLGKMLLNSNLIFKKIELKNSNEKTSLHVEVKI